MNFFFSVSDTRIYSEKENPSSPNGSRTYDLPINISVIYRWAKGDPWELKAIKLGLSAYSEKENLRHPTNKLNLWPSDY